MERQNTGIKPNKEQKLLDCSLLGKSKHMLYMDKILTDKRKRKVQEWSRNVEKKKKKKRKLEAKTMRSFIV